MKIRMLHTRMGTEDGYLVKEYKKGNIYNVSQWLARYFFKEKVAVLVNDAMQKLYKKESQYNEF